MNNEYKNFVEEFSNNHIQYWKSGNFDHLDLMDWYGLTEQEAIDIGSHMKWMISKGMV